MVHDNEYRKNALKELSKMLKVNVYHYKTESYMGWMRMTTTTFGMCMLNGVKYVMAGNVCSGFTSKTKTLINRGLLKKEDLYYFLGENNRQNCFVRVDTLEGVADKIVNALSDKYNSQNRILPVIRAARSADISNEIVSQSEIDNSTKAYHAYRDFMASSRICDKEEQAKKEYAEERAAEERLIQQEKEKEKTLRDLVSQIEAMGWHVTLSIKE